MGLIQNVVILRVDPTKKNVVPMLLRVGKDASSLVSRVCRAKSVAWRELQEVEGVKLVVAAGIDVDEAMQGWRLKGGEDTGGIGILFGHGEDNGMLDCPVKAEWVRSRIIWLDGEDVDQREQRAEDVIAIMDSEITGAMRSAIPIPPSGEMWLPKKFDAVFDAAVTLGLGTSDSGGQKLTALGIAVHDKLAGAV